MEKRRIRLEINGVVCGLITQESEEYMRSLAGEVGDLMKEILAASPFITREAAALTAALSYCDDAKKNGVKAARLNDRVEELEVEAEIWQEDKEKMLAQAAVPDEELRKKLETLERENTRLSEAVLMVAELEGRIRRLSDENTALQEAAQRAAGLEEQLQHLRKEQAEAEASAGEAEELKETIEKLSEENRGLQEAAQRVAGLEEQLQHLRKEQAEAEAFAGETEELKETIEKLSEENKALREAAGHAPGKEIAPEKAETEKRGGSQKKWKNPLRHEELDQLGLVSFFEKNEGGKKHEGH